MSDPSSNNNIRSKSFRDSHRPRMIVRGSHYAVSEQGGHDYGTLDAASETHETPTPSEKVSRWHRDIFLMSPNGNDQQTHPRQCLCETCMAEYGTYKFYNRVLQNKQGTQNDDSSGVAAAENNKDIQKLRRRVDSAMSHHCKRHRQKGDKTKKNIFDPSETSHESSTVDKESTDLILPIDDHDERRGKEHNHINKGNHKNGDTGFRDMEACPVNGCPLNPSTRYVCGKAEQALFSRSSSSSGATESSSSLRIRGNSGCTERRWFICVSLAMIFTVLVASVGIYFGYQFLRSHLPIAEKVYNGKFVISSGDYLPLFEPTTKERVGPGTWSHMEKTRFYQHKLDLIFSGSKLARKYIQNDVFLVERNGDDGLTVHFNVHMDSTKGKIMPDELTEIIRNEIENADEKIDSVFGKVVIDADTIQIRERIVDTASTTRHSGVFVTPASTEFDFETKPKRVCSPFQIDYCSHLPYNFTTFPNAMGHRNVEEAQNDLNQFRETVDSKCYALAYEFLCQLLQPVCFQNSMVLPCQQFCDEFMDNCSNILPGELRDRIRCSALKTESDGPGSCISKPGCIAEMRKTNRGDQVCDGIVDCPDFSDELYCSYCPEQHFHCGVGKMCIPKEQMCDGVVDCDNAADEKGCLSLVPRMDFTSYIHQYYDSGYLVYQESGKAGKVCADHMNKTVPTNDVGRVLDKLGESMCNMLEYRAMKRIELKVDEEEGDVRYVDMIGPMSADKSFITVPCPTKEVVYVECEELQCGRRPAHVQIETQTRRTDLVQPRKAQHGDWPWHVALFKDGQHVCDGTLVDKLWIMTTVSCFQGQGKAKWFARFASIRLGSRAPWEQIRRIVGMVKTPVEGNTIVILKMNEPVSFSDFVRPICLADSDEFIHMGVPCVTLGWDSQDDQLRVIHLEPAEKEICEEKSVVPSNTICTREILENSPCLGEEVAGAPLMCQMGEEWHLVGVSSWRKGCSRTAERPRIYDKVSLSSEWTFNTIEEMTIE